MAPSAIVQVETMDDLYQAQISYQRSFMLVAYLTCALSLMMAMVGLHGVLSSVVAARETEIGVCLALGASAFRLLALVVRPTLTLALAGVATGLLIGWAFGRFAQALFYATSVTEPSTYIAVACVVTLAAMVAMWRPVQWTLKADPARALRSDGC